MAALWDRLSVDHYLHVTNKASEAQGEEWTCRGSHIQLVMGAGPQTQCSWPEARSFLFTPAVCGPVELW